MNKRRYSNRRRKNILRVFILLMTIIITVVMWRTIKINVQVGELILPKILQSEKSFADTSGEWNLILVDRNHYIPNHYQVELTELSNGKKWIHGFIQNYNKCLMMQELRGWHCLLEKDIEQQKNNKKLWTRKSMNMKNKDILRKKQKKEPRNMLQFPIQVNTN